MHALDFWLAITRYILTSKIPSNFPHPRYERTYRPHISSARRGKWLEKFHVTRGISTWTTAFTKCERVCVSKRHAYKEIGTPPPCRHEAVLFSSCTGMCRVCVRVCNVESHVLLPNQDQLFPSLIYLVYTSFLVYFRKSCFLPLFSATSSSFCPRYTPLVSAPYFRSLPCICKINRFEIRISVFPRFFQE